MVPVKQLEPREEFDLVIHGMCRGKQDSQKSTGEKRIKRQVQRRKTIVKEVGKAKTRTGIPADISKSRGEQTANGTGRSRKVRTVPLTVLQKHEAHSYLRTVHSLFSLLAFSSPTELSTHTPSPPSDLYLTVTPSF